MEPALLDPFIRMLGQVSTPAAVRRAETGDDSAIWGALTASGFVDALVAEAGGGFGLAPAEIVPLLIACGSHLLPAAFGETMVARALAAAAGSALPMETQVLLWPIDSTGRLRSLLPPPKFGATHALVQQGGEAALYALNKNPAPSDGFGQSAATIDNAGAKLIAFDLAEDRLYHWCIALTVASMAGALARALDLTLRHVNDREQFGRKLANFQAIQQQVSVFAEHVALATVAAHLAISRPMPGPTALDAAIAKIVADEAATIGCAVAHAAHGAIGITAEHDLALYTRRIKRWQASFGASASHARLVGGARLGTSCAISTDFLRVAREP
jgi:acyl-CoA dehydrogenase